MQTFLIVETPKNILNIFPLLPTSFQFNLNMNYIRQNIILEEPLAGLNRSIKNTSISLPWKMPYYLIRNCADQFLSDAKTH
jgi:hypothetical protein